MNPGWNLLTDADGTPAKSDHSAVPCKGTRHLSTLTVKLSARADGKCPLLHKCHAPSANNAQGHACPRPGLDSDSSQTNAPGMLQTDAYVVCSANKEQQQTHRPEGNAMLPMLSDQTGLHSRQCY